MLILKIKNINKIENAPQHGAKAASESSSMGHSWCFRVPVARASPASTTGRLRLPGKAGPGGS